MVDEKMKILIIGAGGAGVSNIAQIYQEQGHQVIGCDRLTNSATDNLVKKGIPVFLDSDMSALDGIDLVFRSAAVVDSHPLITEAKARSIKIISRYELFEDLSATRQIIAIAGSSGKTSTTGITAHIMKGDRDCGYLIGIHGNGGHNGVTDEFIVEADEYAKTFLHLDPIDTGLITGCKYDHVDIYPTKNDYDQAFKTFASRCDKLIINGDDKYLVSMTQDLRPITYGKQFNVDYQAININNFEGGSSFDIIHQGNIIASIKLQVIGGHNVINALAGFVVNIINMVPLDSIVDRLASFQGLPRRLEVLRTSPFHVYDDYAHLPYELETVLRGIRESYPNRRILAYFQGHTYTRINAFFDDYAKALSHCDCLFLGNIYAARDSSGSVDVDQLLSQVQCDYKVLSGTIENTIELISQYIQPQDILICLNAGDGTKVAHHLANIQINEN
jgi:UDP-N-acetylmuramate--alanine ligase